MIASVRAYIALGLLSFVMQGGVEPFAPFTERAYRLVNSVAFTPDDGTMYMALLYRDVLAHLGRPDSTAPEVGLFVSRRIGDAWSTPELLPFSGQFGDYEPSLTPDGEVMLFNSKRRAADGRVPTRNDLWMVSRTGAGWSEPRPLSGINSFALEESYPTIDRQRRFVYTRGPVVEGGDDFDLYESRLLPDGSTATSRRLPFSDDRFGEGDSQLAPDGSFLIFTRWDHRVGWQQTCDLYIAFRRGDGWTEPVAAVELNTLQPDYGAALSSDGRWLYHRMGGRFVRRPLEPFIIAARARAG